MNASEFLESIIKTNDSSGSKLHDVLNSVLEDSRKPKGIIGNIKMNTVKVRVNSGKQGVISFRGIDLVFDKDGIAEVPVLLKPEVEKEMCFRPGVYSFVEEVQEDITVLQMLEQAREEVEKELEKDNTSEDNNTEEETVEEDKENMQSDEVETKPAKKGRKGKV
jgi:hypothetical protein